MNLSKLFAPVASVICLAGCGEHSEVLRHLPNGQVRIDTVENGVPTKTRLYGRDGKLIFEGKADSAE